MAFIDQVQDLTSLTVSDTGELSQFLKDGVIDVTNKWLAIKPQDVNAFMAVTAELTSNGYDLNTSRIINVIREDGNDNQWRNCRKIAPALQYDVTDTESLNYASKINPAYMIGEDNQISVFPVATSSPAQNAYKIYYVNNDPQNESGVSLAHSHSDIKYFPTDKVYLVVIYAGLRLIQTTIGSIANLSITAVPPDTPSTPSYSTITVAAQTAGSLGTAPTYTKPSYTAPTVAGDGDELTDVSILDSDNTIDTHADQLEFDQWWSTAGHLIEGEEDTELAGAQISKINSYINAWQVEANRRMQTYQADIQNELNEFNKENAAYQSTVQEALQELSVAAAKAQKDADFSQQKQIDEYAKKLQRYQNEITAYQADVASQVQEHGAKLQGLQAQYVALKADYEGAFASAAPKGR